jgi:predicted glycosyl hydrolase (DUF1957 family)
MKQISTSLLLHANILYAEIPFANIPQVVENSYLPVLKAILNNQKLKLILNLSGFTLEVLNGDHRNIYKGEPEIIALLKKAISNGQIELTGTSWSHAVLPLLPEDLIKKDIALHLYTLKRILDYKPKGFFPPELGISPALPSILKDAGFLYCFFDRDFINLTKKGHLNTFNDFEPAQPVSFTKLTARAKFRGLATQLKHLKVMQTLLKKETVFHPILWQGTDNASITGIGCDCTWMTYSLICLSRIAVLNEKKLISTISRLAPTYEGLFMPYSSDIEFYGYGGNTIKDPVPVSRLEVLFKHLCDNPAIKLTTPSEYLNENENNISETLYLKSGTWSSDKNFDLWEKEADNAQLNKYCYEAYTSYKKKYKLKNKGLPHGKELNILKDLLLSYNSDGRGWTPLPEHRLFCFNKAHAVKKVLEY